jgi:hypothetical protein
LELISRQLGSYCIAIEELLSLKLHPNKMDMSLPSINTLSVKNSSSGPYLGSDTWETHSSAVNILNANPNGAVVKIAKSNDKKNNKASAKNGKKLSKKGKIVKKNGKKGRKKSTLGKKRTNQKTPGIFKGKLKKSSKSVKSGRLRRANKSKKSLKRKTSQRS